MPNVASDLKFHGLSRLQQQAARQGMSTSPATTPFDSILDQATRPDPAPRPPRAADDNAPRAERGQRAKSADRPAKADDSARPSDTDAPAQADAADDTVKAGTKPTDANTTDTKSADTKAADATAGDKASDQIETGDDVTIGDASPPLTDAKPADAGASGPVAVVIDPAAVPVANTVLPDTKGETKAQTPAIAATAATATSDATEIVATGATTATAATAATSTAATAATAPTPTTASKAAIVTAAATATSGQPDAVTADGSTEATLADPPANVLAAPVAKPEKTDKADPKSDKKAEADKKAASAPTTLKPTATPDPEATQAANGEPAKDTGAHVRAEAAANFHRGGGDTASNTATKDGTAVPATSKAPDLTPPPGLTVQTPATMQASGALTATVAPAAIVPSDNSELAVPIAGVAFEITSKALSGRNQFDIRLDPPDLGRIHVRLDVDRDGNVITHMVADRTDTLDLLRKDTTGLERALQDAGLKTSDNSLQFSLRDQQTNQQQRNGGGESAHVVIEDEQLAATEPAQRNYARYKASTGGLDIRV